VRGVILVSLENASFHMVYTINVHHDWIQVFMESVLFIYVVFLVLV
jgi:hypothetical protein